MTNCEQYQTALDRRMQGEDADLPANALDQHVAECKDCTTYREWAALVDEAVGSGDGRPDDVAPQVDWASMERALRWRARRPQRRLAWTIFLIVASVATAAAREPQALLVALGLGLAVLPGRIRDVRGARPPSGQDDGDVVELYQRELREQRVRCFGSLLFYSAMAALFLGLAPFATEPRVTLSVAAALLVAAVIQSVRLARSRSPNLGVNS